MRNVSSIVSIRVIVFSALFAVAITACSQENARDTSDIEAEAYIDIANIYQNQGQYRSAAIELQNALQAAPGNQRALMSVARLNIEIGSVPQAIEILEELASRDGASDEIGLLLAQAKMLSNSPQEAIALAEQLQPASSEDQNQRNWIIGNSYAMNGNSTAADEVFQSILTIDPNHIDTLIGLSKIAYMSGDLALASDYMDRAIAASPNNLDLWIWRGSYASLNAQYSDAEIAFTEALQIMSSYDMITQKRFSVLQAILTPLQMQQKNDEALRYSQLIAETPQGQFQNSFENALELFNQGNFGDAETALLDALRIAPDHPDGNILLGMTSYAQGNFDAAARSLTNFVDMASASPQSVKTLAATHLQLGRPELALNLLSEALTLYPTDAALISMIGLSHQYSGNIEESINSFNQALAIQPESAEIRFALARSYLLDNNLSEASDNLILAIDANPQYEQAKATLIDLYIRQNDNDTAMDTIQSWLSIDPASATNNNLAGIIELREKNFVEARNYFNKTLSSDPENIQAKLLLANVAVGQENYLQAQTQLKNILERDPTNVQALSGILGLGRITGSEIEEIAFVQNAIDQYPNAYLPSVVLAQYHVANQDFERAQELAELALSRSENPMTQNVLADILVRRASVTNDGNFGAESTPLIERALELQPDNLAVLNTAARIANQQGRDEATRRYIDHIKTLNSGVGFEVEGDLLTESRELDDAENAYRQGWDISQSPSLGEKLVRTLTMLERTEDVTTFLNEWTSIAPRNGAANLLIATDYLQKNQESDAVRHYEIAIQELPNNLIVLNNLAWLYQDSSPSRALELAGRAVTLFPDNADIHDTYGWVLYKQGRKDDAITALRRAKDLAPDSETISEHLEAALRL